LQIREIFFSIFLFTRVAPFNMTNKSITNSFETFLASMSESDWNSAIAALLPSIHPVDRNAVQIWFRFYPLSLEQFLSASEDRDEAKRSIAMQGDFGLAGRIDEARVYRKKIGDRADNYRLADFLAAFRCSEDAAAVLTRGAHTIGLH